MSPKCLKIKMPKTSKTSKPRFKIRKLVECVGCDMNAAEIAFKLPGKRIHRNGLTYKREELKKVVNVS